MSDGIPCKKARQPRGAVTVLSIDNCSAVVRLRIAGVERGTCPRVEWRDILQYVHFGKRCVGRTRSWPRAFELLRAGADAIDHGYEIGRDHVDALVAMIARNHVSSSGILHGGIHRCVFGRALLLVSCGDVPYKYGWVESMPGDNRFAGARHTQ